VVLQGLFLTKPKGELFAMVDMTGQRVEAFEDGNNKVGRAERCAGLCNGIEFAISTFQLATRPWFLQPAPTPNPHRPHQ
jgi:hypothetical protein